MEESSNEFKQTMMVVNVPAIYLAQVIEKYSEKPPFLYKTKPR